MRFRAFQKEGKILIKYEERQRRPVTGATWGKVGLQMTSEGYRGDAGVLEQGYRGG